MGIAGAFLPDVLAMAGNKVNLSDLSDGILGEEERGINKVLRRKLRIGIDISSWVISGTIGNGRMLADDRHLSNFGRASLIQEQKEQEEEHTAGAEDNTSKNNNDVNDDENHLPDNVKAYVITCVKYVLDNLLKLHNASNADLLVVLDGETPPLKLPEVRKRRTKRDQLLHERDKPVNAALQEEKDIEASIQERTRANRRAGAGKYFYLIRSELIVALRQFEVPFMVAPYEADSQLAYLSKTGYLDLVITEDSDLVAHGTRSTLYKCMPEIIKNDVPRGILVQISDIGAVGKYNGFTFQDFTPAMMAVLFVAAGCDYCEKLSGIGLVTACKVIRTAFFVPRKDDSQSNLSVVIDELFKCSYAYTGDDDYSDQRQEYEESFMMALLMYRHPIAYDPVLKRCIIVGDPVNQGGDQELVDHKKYADLCRDPTRIHQAIGDLRDPKLDTIMVELVKKERHPAFRKVAPQDETMPQDQSEEEEEEEGPNTQEMHISRENNEDEEDQGSCATKISLLERLWPFNSNRTGKKVDNIGQDGLDRSPQGTETPSNVDQPSEATGLDHDSGPTMQHGVDRLAQGTNGPLRLSPNAETPTSGLNNDQPWVDHPTHTESPRGLSPHAMQAREASGLDDDDRQGADRPAQGTESSLRISSKAMQPREADDQQGVVRPNQGIESPLRLPMQPREAADDDSGPATQQVVDCAAQGTESALRLSSNAMQPSKSSGLNDASGRAAQQGIDLPAQGTTAATKPREASELQDGSSASPQGSPRSQPMNARRPRSKAKRRREAIGLDDSVESSSQGIEGPSQSPAKTKKQRWKTVNASTDAISVARSPQSPPSQSKRLSEVFGRESRDTGIAMSPIEPSKKANKVVEINDDEYVPPTTQESAGTPTPAGRTRIKTEVERIYFSPKPNTTEAEIIDLTFDSSDEDDNDPTQRSSNETDVENRSPNLLYSSTPSDVEV